MDNDGWTFLCGCAPRVDFAFFARERDDLVEQDVVAASFYTWDDSDPDPNLRWGIYESIVEWRPQGMATIKPPGAERIVVALGSSRQYFELEPASATEYTGVIEGLPVAIRRVAAI